MRSRRSPRRGRPRGQARGGRRGRRSTTSDPAPPRRQAGPPGRARSFPPETSARRPHPAGAWPPPARHRNVPPGPPRRSEGGAKCWGGHRGRACRRRSPAGPPAASRRTGRRRPRDRDGWRRAAKAPRAARCPDPSILALRHSLSSAHAPPVPRPASPTILSKVRTWRARRRAGMRERASSTARPRLTPPRPKAVITSSTQTRVRCSRRSSSPGGSGVGSPCRRPAAGKRFPVHSSPTQERRGRAKRCP